MIDTLYTWQGVNNAILRDRLQSQKDERQAAEVAQKLAEAKNRMLQYTFAIKEVQIREAAKGEALSAASKQFSEKEAQIQEEAIEAAMAEANKLLDYFDDDVQRLKDQVEELTRTNEALQFENQGLKAKPDAIDSIPVLYLGDEYEDFQDEIKKMLLSTLSDAKKNIHKHSRRMDVINDIIDSNHYQHLCGDRAEEVKRLLKDYTGLTSKLRQELEALGIEISEEGKHYKLLYYGDSRYCAVLSKTPSDGRTGKNNAATIIRIML